MADTSTTTLDELFEAGAHVGYSRSRTHPSTRDFIYEMKQHVAVIDLEKTAAALAQARAFLAEQAAAGASVLFVGTKPEARDIVRSNSERIAQPFVINRWIGGTLTNFNEIRGRVSRLEQLRHERDSGEWDRKYTKREQMMREREIARLEERFGGLVGLEQLPAALVVVDPHHEEIAVAEAVRMRIPVVALAGPDCNINNITYPIVANDTMQGSISYIVNACADAYGDAAPTSTTTEQARATTV